MNTQNIGQGINDILGGLLNPIVGTGNALLGSTQTVETKNIDPNAASNRKTAILVVTVLGVIVIITIGVMMFKKSSQS